MSTTEKDKAEQRKENNQRALQRKERNNRELGKLKDAEDKLNKIDPVPGSDEETRKKRMLKSIAKKKKNLQRQNQLIDEYTKSKSSKKRKAIKKRLDRLKKSDQKSKQLAQTPAGAIAVKCQVIKANLTKVEFLDGSDSKILTGEGKQYVNLPREDKWVDPKFAKNIDRLGQKVRVRVEFDKPGHHSFKLTLIPGGNNAAYSDSEKSRNGGFKISDPTPFKTKSNGKAIVETMVIAAAGDDTYEVEGEDLNGTKKKASGKIKTHRLVYYKEFRMDHANVKEATNLAQFESAFDDCFIKMESLGKTTMTHQPNIGSNADTNTFRNNLHTAFVGSNANDKTPYAVAIAYTDHLAVKRPNQLLTTPEQDVGPGKGPVTIDVKGPGITNPAVKDRYLWINLVPGEGWLESAEFFPSGGGPSVDVKDKCTAVAGGNPNMRKQVRVDVSSLPAGKGIIRLRVNWVDRMRGGLALGGNNAALVCTRAWWRDMSNNKQVHVIIHEVGHKVQMVADGTGISPDKVATHYDSSKGHRGNHCYNGNPDGQARYDSATDRSNATCVMYGSTNPNMAFCGNCKPAVRKVDLKSGWTTI